MMKPITRKEKILDAILSGNTDNIPTPITREETYLKAIAENGGGGGGAESTIAWKPTVDANGNISWTRTSSTTVPATQNIKGNKGNTGDKGDKGETGPAGPGLASGGVAGSLLFKSSNDDYATEWVDSGIATVEGNPVTAETDSAGIGVKTVVDIEPQQDLHGYDHPWVGGAGKNKFDSDTVLSAFTKNNNKYVGMPSYVADNYVISGGFKTNTRYTLSYKAYNNTSTSSNFRFIFSYTDETEEIIGGFVDTTTEKVIVGTSAENKTISKIKRDYGNGAELTLYDIQLEEGSTATSFAPYSNICPISGWDECNVTRCGENLFDKATITENKIINDTTGEESVSYGRFASDYIKVNPSTDYYASNVIKSAQWYCVFYYDKNKNYLSCGDLSSTGYTASGVVTTPSGCNYARLVGVTTYKDDVSFVVGNQAPSSYSAYNGATYTIDLDGTRYGGTLDVESGVLTVDRGFITFDGSEDEIISTYDEGELFMVDYANFGDLVPKKDINGIPTNRISPSATRMGNTAFELYWRGLPSDVRTVAALRTWLASNNLQVCYELATPYTIQLTPHQIKLLQGVNNLSTNAHSVSLTYRKGKVAMNSDLEGLADSVNVLVDEVDSFGIKPLTATALSDAVTISTFLAMKINKNVIFSCRVVITPTEEGSMPLFTIDGVECSFEHTAIGRNNARGIDGRWSIAQDTNILTWTVVSTELDKANDILIQGVLAVK